MMAAAMIAEAATLAPSVTKNWRPASAAPVAPPADDPGAPGEYTAKLASSPGESNAGIVGACIGVSDVIA